MTSFAFIAGLIPLMRIVGASAQGNKSVSIDVAGGMLLGALYMVDVKMQMLVANIELYRNLGGGWN